MKLERARCGTIVVSLTQRRTNIAAGAMLRVRMDIESDPWPACRKTSTSAVGMDEQLTEKASKLAQPCRADQPPILR
jgi:hypothetical protein